MMQSALRMLQRVSMLCITGISVLACHGQQVHHYRMAVNGMSTTLQEKRITSLLFQSDALSEVHVDRLAGLVEWKSALRWDRFSAETLLHDLQMTILNFEEVGVTQQPSVAEAPERRMQDMPRFIDTGDAQLDNQRYDAYKAAWIAAHPEEYEQLTAPAGTSLQPGSID
ncbi:MAG: hypothetical protein JNM62_08245 [Flavobacteriales bacterium]|nr:hypothetical protein [Flavobacteriales bacterium]